MIKQEIQKYLDSGDMQGLDSLNFMSDIMTRGINLGFSIPQSTLTKLLEYTESYDTVASRQHVVLINLIQGAGINSENIKRVILNFYEKTALQLISQIGVLVNVQGNLVLRDRKLFYNALLEIDSLSSSFELMLRISPPDNVYNELSEVSIKHIEKYIDSLYKDVDLLQSSNYHLDVLTLDLLFDVLGTQKFKDFIDYAFSVTHFTGMANLTRLSKEEKIEWIRSISIPRDTLRYSQFNLILKNEDMSVQELIDLNNATDGNFRVRSSLISKFTLQEFNQLLNTAKDDILRLKDVDLEKYISITGKAPERVLRVYVPTSQEIAKYPEMILNYQMKQQNFYITREDLRVWNRHHGKKTKLKQQSISDIIHSNAYSRILTTEYIQYLFREMKPSNKELLSIHMNSATMSNILPNTSALSTYKSI